MGFCFAVIKREQSKCLGRVQRCEGSAEWERELVARATEAKLLIQDGHPDLVLAQMGQWSEETVANLGVDSAHEDFGGC